MRVYIKVETNYNQKHLYNNIVFYYKKGTNLDGASGDWYSGSNNWWVECNLLAYERKKRQERWKKRRDVYSKKNFIILLKDYYYKKP